MSELVACQPGWLAVFEHSNGNGFETEPIACWLRIAAHGPSAEVRPICAMGSEIGDATLADNYVGVVGPGGDPKKLYEAVRAARERDKRSA